MFVGTQMAFILSPFVGREPEFYVFHRTSGNFYAYVWGTLVEKFDGRLNPRDAKQQTRDVADAALHALQQGDHERLARLIHPSGLRVIRNGVPYNLFDSQIDPVFTADAWVDAARRNAVVKLYEKRDQGKLPEISSVRFQEMFDRWIFDTDYTAVADRARYNEFTRGVEHKERLLREFPNAVFVEYVVEQSGGRWSALRLVFTPGYENDLRLVAIVHDQSF